MSPARAVGAAYDAAPSNAAPIRTGRVSARRYFGFSRMHQRARVFEILRSDGGGGPVGEGADGAGRIVSGVLRKRACSYDEQIGHVPALQIAVQHAVAGIIAHDGAAAEM